VARSTHSDVVATTHTLSPPGRRQAGRPSEDERTDDERIAERLAGGDALQRPGEILAIR
jgi:hypothetical protein